MKNLLLLLSVCFFPLAVQAQTDSLSFDSLFTENNYRQADVRPLDSIIIQENRWQATRADQNRDIQIITQQDIKNLPVKSLNEVLSYALGVDLRQRGPFGSQADISIDGSTFDQVVVLLNGVRMSDPQTGHNMMNLPVPLIAIDHIEILRGAASAQYGVNALAGAVNVVTKVATNDDMHAQAYLGTSVPQAINDPKGGGGAQIDGTLRLKNIGQRLALSYDNRDAAYQSQNCIAKKLFYQNDWKFNDRLSLQSMFGYIDNAFDARFYYAAPVDSYAFEQVKTLLAAAALIYRPDDQWRVTARASFRNNNDDYIFTSREPEYYHNTHETWVGSAELHAQRRLKSGHLGFGLEERVENIDSKNLGQHQRNNFGAFAEYGYVQGRFSAGANLFANANSDYGMKVYPALNFGYRLPGNWKLFLNGGMSQRLPIFTDLYYKGPTNIGNADLKPEEAIYAEGGIRYSNADRRMVVQYSTRKVTDFIDWVRSDVKDPWQPMNFGSQTVRVFSISAAQNLNSLFSIDMKPRLWLDLGWNNLSQKRSDPGSEFAKYTTEALKNQVIAGLRMNGMSRFAFSINARYLERYSLNSYVLLDIHAEYRYSNVQFFGDLNNALDTEYAEISAVPMPGRFMSLGFRLALP